MKLIQTIIAFVTIYLFVGVLLLFGLFFSWLSSYISDIPSQKIATVTVGALEGTTAPFVYYDNAISTASTSILTRGTAQKGEKGQAVLAARSSVIIATFKKVTLDESLVPLGFKTMYRLEKATDASGQILYERKSSVIDELFTWLFQKKMTFDTQNVTLLATEKDKSYTLNVKEGELIITTANEN